MRIEKGRVVDLDYSLHLGDGQVVDRSGPGEPLTYLHGEGEIVPGLESALEGAQVGDRRQVVVAPAEGYGDHDPQGIQRVPRQAFPADFRPQVGMELSAQGPDGDEVAFVIQGVEPDTVTIDLNHPLAGKTLHFDVTVREVRAATAEELEHGHVHGAGDHGHEH
jgi:FKBP-type peptidyl-prolyl cis-trans isomerase SlyD